MSKEATLVEVTHTLTPWFIEKPPFTSQSKHIHISGHRASNAALAKLVSGKPESEANAARIVACVNACAGISNEALADGIAATRPNADGLVEALADARQALKMQEGAELWNANCCQCEGEGDWTECDICSDAFGKAIDKRNAVIPKLDAALSAFQQETDRG